MPGRVLRTAPGRTLLRLALSFRLPVPPGIAFITALKAYMVVFDEYHRRWPGDPGLAPLDRPIVLFRSLERRPVAPLPGSARSSSIR